MGSGKRIEIGGVTYPSKRTAARALGISRTSLRKAIKHGDYHGKPIITKTAHLPLKSRTLEFWLKTNKALEEAFENEYKCENGAENRLIHVLSPPARGDMLVIDDCNENCEKMAETSNLVDHLA